MGDWTPRVAVDLDGVLAQYDGWEGLAEIGDPVEGAKNFMEHLGAMGCHRIVWTTRINPDPFEKGERRHEPEHAVRVVEKWLNEHGFEFEEVFDGIGKPIAVAYIDNRGVMCRPDDSKRPGPEWRAALAHVGNLVAEDTSEG